jgi:CRISPR-associated endoribonuclease Cas6
MRIKLILRPSITGDIPLNYQYYLSGAIYKILRNSSPEYARFLHNQDYTGQDGKPRKLFTFSFLTLTPHRKPENNKLLISLSTKAILYVSSPMLNDFIQNFVKGLFYNQKIVIRTKNTDASFFIEQVETISEPEFKATTKFIALSPIVLTTKLDTTEGLKTYFFRPLDEGLSEAIRKSLLRKYETVYKKRPADDRLKFKIDKEYIQRRGGPAKVSKLITIRQGDPGETKIKAFVTPFTLIGSKELMQTAWNCGIGDKCSMGFGCIGVGG